MAERADQISRHVQPASVVQGPATPDLLECTLGDFLRQAAELHADRLAVVSAWQGKQLTFSQLDYESDRLAASFLALGLAPGDRLAICAGNCIEYNLIFYAAAKIGLILVVLNPSYTKDELCRALQSVGVKVLIITRTLGSRSFLDHVRCLCSSLPEITIFTLLKPKERAFTDTMDFASLLSDKLQSKQRAEVLNAGGRLTAHDTINMQFTSGTTGLPKAVCLTHRNILNNGRFVGDRMALTVDDRLCIPVPLFHCFGLVLGKLAAMTHYSCAIYASEVFDPRAILETVQKYRCTALHGVPTMFIALLELMDRNSVEYDTSSLRTGIAAGTVVTAGLMTRIQSRLGLSQLTITYGMTETSPASTMTSTTDPLSKRTSSVGCVMPHTTVKVVDEAGAIVPRGVPGEVLVSGYLLHAGYWNDLEATTASTQMETTTGRVFIKTGDVGVLDAEGYLSIPGRIKDLIIRGGENISPSEIENVLAQCPGVSDVSVVAVRDARYGEVPAAFVKLHPSSASPLTSPGSKKVKGGGPLGTEEREGGQIGEESARHSHSHNHSHSHSHTHHHAKGGVTHPTLHAFAASRMAHFKCPAYYFFLPPDQDFPKTASGKIQKYLLRDTANAKVDALRQCQCRRDDGIVMQKMRQGE